MKTKTKVKRKRKWAVVAVYSGGDGFRPLVELVGTFSSARWAKKVATDLAHEIYEETCNPERDGPFDRKWEKVDNEDPAFMDWGFDPDGDGTILERIRVVNYEE